MKANTNKSKSASAHKSNEVAKTPKVSCTMALNDEHNGVELTFSAKPSDKLREGLKSAGFHFHGKRQVWYAKQSEDTLAIAKALSEGSVDGAQPKAVKPAKKASTKSKVVAESIPQPKAVKASTKSKKPAKAEPKAPKAKVEQMPIAFESKSKPKASNKKLLAALNKTEGLVAEMDRAWLWVSGDTRKYSESLKALGFRFSGRRQAWYLA